MHPPEAPPQRPEFHPRRLVRWALFFPAALLAWIFWQLLVARLFYDGVFQAGLTWVEGSAEALFILVAALIVPTRKRRVASVALVFFIIRDLAVGVSSPSAGTMSDALVAIAMATMATAVVWWYARS